MAVTTKLSYKIDGEWLEHPATLPQKMDTALAHVIDVLNAMRESDWDDAFKIEVEEV